MGKKQAAKARKERLQNLKDLGKMVYHAGQAGIRIFKEDHGLARRRMVPDHAGPDPIGLTAPGGHLDGTSSTTYCYGGAIFLLVGAAFSYYVKRRYFNRRKPEPETSPEEDLGALDIVINP